MLSHYWRDGPFPHCGEAFRSLFNSVIGTASIATAIAGIALSPISADSIEVGEDQ